MIVGMSVCGGVEATNLSVSDPTVNINGRTVSTIGRTSRTLRPLRTLNIVSDGLLRKIEDSLGLTGKDLVNDISRVASATGSTLHLSDVTRRIGGLSTLSDTMPSDYFGARTLFTSIGKTYSRVFSNVNNVTGSVSGGISSCLLNIVSSDRLRTFLSNVDDRVRTKVSFLSSELRSRATLFDRLGSGMLTSSLTRSVRSL